jgi:hypothetical protein
MGIDGESHRQPATRDPGDLAEEDGQSLAGKLGKQGDDGADGELSIGESPQFFQQPGVPGGRRFFDALESGNAGITSLLQSGGGCGCVAEQEDRIVLLRQGMDHQIQRHVRLRAHRLQRWRMRRKVASSAFRRAMLRAVPLSAFWEQQHAVKGHQRRAQAVAPIAPGDAGEEAPGTGCRVRYHIRSSSQNSGRLSRMGRRGFFGDVYRCTSITPTSGGSSGRLGRDPELEWAAFPGNVLSGAAAPVLHGVRGDPGR